MASVPPPTSAFTLSSVAKSLVFPSKRLQSFKPLFSGEGPPEDDPVKLAFAKAADYRKSKSSVPPPNQTPYPDPEGTVVVADPVKIAMEKARDYRKNKGITGSSTANSGGKNMNISNSSERLVENKGSKKEELRISNIDFLGLGFSEKKSYRGTPPGLVPVVEPFLKGELPEVEFIVGDASKFEVTTPKTSRNEENNSMDLYKPKVSTWGVFPRPNNISKTFGGGRVIHPGEVLETLEAKEAREKLSKELITAYKTKMGLSIDPTTKAECEKALNEGNKLMDLGKLREALPFYEKVMKDLVFQSELHGLAALQWSICQDSLRSPMEARVMYEKLQSHPNVQVSKKARQFVYSFQAMEMLKVKTPSYSSKTGYENYFEALLEKKVNYIPKEEEQDEGALRQSLPYILFLLSPIFFVLFVAVRKSFQL